MAAVKTENGLTDKQEKFCQVFVETSNASEAYRRSYDTKEAKNETVCNEAYKLLCRPDIAQRIDLLRAELKERSLVTAESVVAELEEARLLAMDIQAPSAAVSASMGKAKIYGLITDKVEAKSKTEVIAHNVDWSDPEKAAQAYRDLLK